MAHHVQRKIIHLVSESPFISLMVDGTTDISNNQQLTIVLWRTDVNFDVYEDFLGIYQIKSSTAESIVSTIQNIFLRLGIPVAKLCGQCYDGCSTVAGVRSGVAARIQQLESKAVFVHCYGHALKLNVNDTMKKSSILRDCLDTCYELIKLVKCSPKRDTMLKTLKEEAEDDAPSIYTLCPIWWTVRAAALASILTNYSKIQSLWNEVLESKPDSETRARILGVASQMETFQYFFSLSLAEMILRHTDNLSKTRQSPKLSSTQGYEIAMLTVKRLRSIRSESDFNLFWEKVEIGRHSFAIKDPCLPRKSKVPQRYESGSGEAQFHSTAKDWFRQLYFKAFDLALAT